MLNKALITAAVVCLSATGSFAETLNCERKSVSKSGFSSLDAAKSWFPETFTIQLTEDEAFMDYYGRGSAERKNGRVYIEFVTVDSRNQKNIVKITFIEKSNRYTSKLRGRAGYTQVAGATGVCSVS